MISNSTYLVTLCDIALYTPWSLEVKNILAFFNINGVSRTIAL